MRSQSLLLQFVAGVVIGLVGILSSTFVTHAGGVCSLTHHAAPSRFLGGCLQD